MIVMKFGGTSVANCEAITRMVSIVGSKLEERPVVVVSALSKVTDSLYRICDFAQAQNEAGAMECLEQLRNRHLSLARELMEGKLQLKEEAEGKVNGIFDTLKSLVCAVCSLGELSDRVKARIISSGEYLSSNIICFAMNAKGIKTNFIDAGTMIITSDDYLKGEPDMDRICEIVPGKVAEAYSGVDAVITQGFVAAAGDGTRTVLGRGGSDYTASLIGMAIDAKRIEIWTDVDGVHTADPRRVENTRSLKRISFEEAAEMAYFGAKVLHPLTIEPAVDKDIPIYVLDSLNPSACGTAILHDSAIEEGVKSISCKENILVINIFSPKMINTFGFLDKVFDIFKEHKVSVDLISTSEANISLTVEAGQNINGVVKDLSAFAEVHVVEGKSQVSVIGKNVINIKGLFKNIFGSLLQYKIYMISQGATAINLSFVIDRQSLDGVMKQLHKLLFE